MANQVLLKQPVRVQELQRRVLVVLNPLAGGIADPDKHQQAIRDAFEKQGWHVDMVLLDNFEQMSASVHSYEKPYDLVAAAGGDGTISSVAEFMVGQSMPLGILPVGTGNVLAKGLGIPTNLEKAIELFVSDFYVKEIDAMRVNGRIALLNASVGISSRTIVEIRREDKRRLGMLAYIWRGVKALAGYQPHRFHLRVDGNTYIYRAAEIVVVNPEFMGLEPFYWGKDVALDDGKIDIFVIRGKSFLDLLSLIGSVLWFINRRSPLLMHIQAHKQIMFDVEKPQPVQIDGDALGTTPVVIEVLPSILKVVVPNPDAKSKRVHLSEYIPSLRS